VQIVDVELERSELVVQELVVGVGPSGRVSGSDDFVEIELKEFDFVAQRTDLLLDEAVALFAFETAAREVVPILVALVALHAGKVLSAVALAKVVALQVVELSAERVAVALLAALVREAVE
jgi:hypothetical protein